MFRFVATCALSMAAAARAEGANCDNPPCLVLPVDRLAYTMDTVEADALQKRPMWRTSETTISTNSGPGGWGQGFWQKQSPSYRKNPSEQLEGKLWTQSWLWSYGILNGGRGYWENATSAQWQHGDPPQWSHFCKLTQPNVGPRHALDYYASFTKHCGVNVACPKPFRDYFDELYVYDSCNCFHPEGDTSKSIWSIHSDPSRYPYSRPQMLSIHPEAQELDAFDDDWGPSDDSTNYFYTAWKTDNVDDRILQDLPCEPSTSEGKTALRGSAFGKGDADAEMPKLEHSHFAQVPDVQVAEFS